MDGNLSMSNDDSLEVVQPEDKIVVSTEGEIIDLLTMAHEQENKVLDLTNIDFSSNDNHGQSLLLQLIADILLSNELLEFIHIDITQTSLS